MRYIQCTGTWVHVIIQNPNSVPPIFGSNLLYNFTGTSFGLSSIELNSRIFSTVLSNLKLNEEKHVQVPYILLQLIVTVLSNEILHEVMIQ
jgi:hypothetical protein